MTTTEQAIARVEALLAAPNWGGTRLSATEISSYAGRYFTGGWRVRVEIAGTMRELRVLVDASFPWGQPRVAIAPPPPPLQWPHVEHDGVLCLMPNGAGVDSSVPELVVVNVLLLALDLLTDCEAGRRTDDFSDEVLSYWTLDQEHPLLPLVSLELDLLSTHFVRYCPWNHERLVGECDDDIRVWITRQTRLPPRRLSTQEALLIRLKEVPPPGAYPRDFASLERLVAEGGDAAVASFERLLVSGYENTIVQFTAPTARGDVILGTKLSVHNSTRMGNGFRAGRVPPRVARNWMARHGTVRRELVDRADAAWVHGRERNSALTELRGKSLAIVGCGSLGAPVAIALAQAGVGALALVDHDQVSRANGSRHPLGARHVDRNKAEALAEHIGQSLPHVRRITALAQPVERVLTDNPGSLRVADVIVATTASWSADSALGAWQLERGTDATLVLGWFEPRACAAHAVAIVPKGGCVFCGFGPTGVPRTAVTRWPGALEFRSQDAARRSSHTRQPLRLMGSRS